MHARTRVAPLRVRALVQDLRSQPFKLRPELCRMAHLRQPVGEHLGQRIKFCL
jgi:hypothetical protein